MIKMQGPAWRLTYVACCVAISLALTGCGDGVKGVDPNLVKVTGKVTIDGKPLTTGDISFISTESESKAYSSKIDSSGNYSLSYSESAAGALPGSYKVRVAAVEGGGAPTGAMGPKGEVSKPKALIPEKYNSPTTSELTATVEKGKSNNINFDLKSM